MLREVTWSAITMRKSVNFISVQINICILVLCREDDGTSVFKLFTEMWNQAILSVYLANLILTAISKVFGLRHPRIKSIYREMTGWCCVEKGYAEEKPAHKNTNTINREYNLEFKGRMHFCRG